MMSYTLVRHLRRTAFRCQKIRFESTLTNVTQEDFVFRPPLAQWSKIMREAEKIVGYPTSFMNLRWLLSDEFANMAMHLRKVVDTNHPIIKTARTIIYNEQNNLQPWGLIILLLSKAVNTFSSLTLANTVTEQQRTLAELTEMIRTAHYVHKGLLNIPPAERGKNTDTAMFANKIALLIGDYLMVTANGMLAGIRNQDLSYLISTALRDLSEGQFFGGRDVQNMPLPGEPAINNIDNFEICSDTLPLDVTDTLGLPIKEWTLRTLYNGGTLFGRGCQGAVLLGGQDLHLQEQAYFFGCHLSLAWQAASELQKITMDSKEPYSLVSAPVLFAISDNNNLYKYIQNYKENVAQVDYESLKIDVLKTDAIERTKMLYRENADKANYYAQCFGDSEAIYAIKRLIKTL